MMKVQIAEVQRFIVDCLRVVGTKMRPAEEQAVLLTYADRMGYPNHGLTTLELYINTIKNKLCEPNNQPEIVQEESSTASINANNVMGGTLGRFAMDVAIKKANATGVGWVGVTGSINNAEPYEYWAQMTACHNLIGMVFNNNTPLPADPRIEQIQLHKSSALKQIPRPRLTKRKTKHGYPDIKLGAPSQMADSGHVMSRLAVMVELLGQNCLEKKEEEDLISWFSENQSDCFIVINPACFILGYTRNTFEPLQYWKEFDSMEDILPATLVNNLDRIAYDSDERCTLNYSVDLICSSASLAHTLNVTPMHILET